jgi:hypothetical protein
MATIKSVVRGIVDSVRLYRQTGDPDQLLRVRELFYELETNPQYSTHLTPQDRAEIPIVRQMLSFKHAQLTAQNAQIDDFGSLSPDAKSGAIGGGGGQNNGGGGQGGQSDEVTTDFTKTLIKPDPEKDKWDNIVGYEAVKARIKANIVLPLLYPGFFEPMARGVMLYGPGGTGKTQLARAIALYSGKPTFLVTSSDIASKWVGAAQKGMAKLLRTVIETAKTEGGAVVFFDEADTLLGAEDDIGKQAVNEFKARYDEVKNFNVVFIVATNNPDAFQDSGVRRRLGLPIYVGLPTKEDMYKLLVRYMSIVKKNCPAVTLPNVEEFNATLYDRMQTFVPDNVRSLVTAAAQYAKPTVVDLEEPGLIFCPAQNDDGTTYLKPSMNVDKDDPKKVLPLPDGCFRVSGPNRLSAAQQKQVCWPSVTVESLLEALKKHAVQPSTSWKTLIPISRYAREKPDEEGQHRICEDFDKFIAYDKYMIKTDDKKYIPHPEYEKQRECKTAAELAAEAEAAAAKASGVPAPPKDTDTTPPITQPPEPITKPPEPITPPSQSITEDDNEDALRTQDWTGAAYKYLFGNAKPTTTTASTTATTATTAATK